MVAENTEFCSHGYLGGGFQYLYVHPFTPIWGRCPISLLLFGWGVETTNQVFLTAGTFLWFCPDTRISGTGSTKADVSMVSWEPEWVYLPIIEYPETWRKYRLWAFGTWASTLQNMYYIYFVLPLSFIFDFWVEVCVHAPLKKRGTLTLCFPTPGTWPISVPVPSIFHVRTGCKVYITYPLPCRYLWRWWFSFSVGYVSLPDGTYPDFP